jgi:hypothetical protein
MSNVVIEPDLLRPQQSFCTGVQWLYAQDVLGNQHQVIGGYTVERVVVFSGAIVKVAPMERIHSPAYTPRVR